MLHLKEEKIITLVSKSLVDLAVGRFFTGSMIQREGKFKYCREVHRTCNGEFSGT